jgi:hypothetical protein
MSRRVLIVSPHFPPTNAPDHQRVRMALPYFGEFGWRATVLAVRPECVDLVQDPYLQDTLPSDVEVVRMGAISKRLARVVGVGSLALRAGRGIRAAGDVLLSARKYDAVFFSTTLFSLMGLGPVWKEKFGVPYVLDFQDPWVSDYFDKHPEQRPPGGRLKYGLAQWRARKMEPQAVRGAAQIVCVSSAYTEVFLQRYSDLKRDKFSTLPFGAPETDFTALEKLRVRQEVFDPKDGLEHWVYVGRGGQDMALAVRAFFRALRRHLNEQPARAQRLRIHFVGTDYAPATLARKTIEPVARECGVEKIVSEQTSRLPYFETLRCLQDADALFIPGSDDPGYTASKLYPYILARKPLLAVFHKNSSVVKVMEETGAGTVVTFNGVESLESATQEIYARWFAVQKRETPELNRTAFEPYTARSMTRRLCEVFDRAAASGAKN